jgi:uncharacterized protein (TIGR03083 family)
MSDTDVAASIDAWRQSFDAIVDLCAGLPAEAWNAPTECPGWTVKDVCSHLVGGELWMSAGHPAPAEGLATIADRPVAERRAADGAAVLAELRELRALRQRQLTDDPPDPAAPAVAAYGLPITLGRLLTERAFDFRRAVGVAGNLDSAAARLSSGVLLAGLGRVVAKSAAAPPGSVVRLTVHGPVAFDRVVTVDAGGRGHPGRWTGEPASTHLRMDWETYTRLAAGRITPAAAHVEVDGDRTVADRVLARFAVTP